MNLLSDDWLPVRPIGGGTTEKITLRQLLCTDACWELCLPRDDMELAALQLLICATQVLLAPKDAAELRSRIARPLDPEIFDIASQPFMEWFSLNHPTYPFMQVRGVAAKESTPMEKLLAGLTGATNSCFVNEPGLAEALCPGCAAIALFNQASCAPSFGGGFKAGLRGSSPVTTLVQGDHLRRTVCLNILAEDELLQNLPWHAVTSQQRPTWVEPIVAGETVPIHQIGIFRGLFWQPAHIELLPAPNGGCCTCCGCQSASVYSFFNKAKFNYTIKGLWPHPHSPRIMSSKKGELEEKFVAFTTSAPAWTQLSRYVVQQETDATTTEGQQPAAVILQAKRIAEGNRAGGDARRLHLVVGGYRNNQASILERRHEVFTLNHGWDSSPAVVHHMVALARGYRDALYKALFMFVNGYKEVKGCRVKVNQSADAQFYRRSEPAIEETLARVEFENPAPELTRMRHALREIAEAIFRESVLPYLTNPEVIRTVAVARRVLYRHLNDLEPNKP